MKRHVLLSGFLEMVSDVFSGGQDFDIHMDFRTDQLNALLLFTYNTQTGDYMLVRSTDTLSLNTENETYKMQDVSSLFVVYLLFVGGAGSRPPVLYSCRRRSRD